MKKQDTQVESDIMQDNKGTIALVCCRGGSKGIVGKNIKNFSGKPLLGWILEAADSSGVFDEIILSTDSEEIASIGQEFGASVPFIRPAELAKDTSDQFDAHKHAFDELNISDESHHVCNLTNNPFINSDLIKESYQVAVKNGFSKIVVDAIKIEGDYTYFRQCVEVAGLLQIYHVKEFMLSGINRQSVSEMYATINNIRWAKPSVLSSYDNYKKSVINYGIDPIWLPKTRNFDLDDQDDWLIAEAVFSNITKTCT